MLYNEIEKDVKNILDSNLPKDFYKFCNRKKSVFGGEYLQIGVAVSDAEIHNVQGQHPQLCTLNLNLETMELTTQVFGGMGGGSIYRYPNPNDSKERYLAMVGVKVPFRKPKRELQFVLRAVERFCGNYIKTLKNNIDTLKYKTIVDYSPVLRTYWSN